MTKKIFSEAVIFILSGLLAVSCGDSSGNVDYVNPNIGGVGFILQPTRPTVQLPNQMIRLSPLRDDLLDEYISCYPLALTSYRLSSVSCSARSAVFKVSFDDSVPGEGFLRFSSLDAGCRYRLNRENALEGEASFSGMKAYLYAEFDEDVRLAFAGADSSAAVLSLPGGAGMRRSKGASTPCSRRC